MLYIVLGIRLIFVKNIFLRKQIPCHPTPPKGPAWQERFAGRPPPPLLQPAATGAQILIFKYILCVYTRLYLYMNINTYIYIYVSFLDTYILIYIYI